MKPGGNPQKREFGNWALPASDLQDCQRLPKMRCQPPTGRPLMRCKILFLQTVFSFAAFENVNYSYFLLPLSLYSSAEKRPEFVSRPLKGITYVTLDIIFAVFPQKYALGRRKIQLFYLMDLLGGKNKPQSMLQADSIQKNIVIKAPVQNLILLTRIISSHSALISAIKLFPLSILAR